MARQPAFLYRTPVQLSRTDETPRRLLILGSCLAEGLPVRPRAVWRDVECDFFLYNNFGELPESPQRPVDAYDLQIAQIPLRSVWREEWLFRLDYRDLAAYQTMLDRSIESMVMLLDGIMKYNRVHGLLTFVFNFLTPQQNHLGRLLPRYDIRNPVHFVEKLNEALAREIATYQNAYLLDFDSIVAAHGRQYFQDDVLWLTTHAGELSDSEHAMDRDRLHPPEPATAYFELRPQEVYDALWAEIRAMYRTVRQFDSVKLVIVDLDDTLWRGVVVEDGVKSSEGWPRGLIEALQLIKRRGVLLAIVSKNDESKIRDLWSSIWDGRILLDDFASVKINWKSKAENIQAVLKEVNLLPRNVVFIDDNPVERSVVEEAFPGIRTLGADLYLIRQILLWSPETQVPAISDESANRTAMIQAQATREEARSAMSREEFLASLNVEIAHHEIRSVHDPKFARAFELINKTNQFNTTGKRWSLEACRAAFDRGWVFRAFEVRDKFTAYGLVGVALMDGWSVDQFVMSCRVIGLGVEQRVLSEIASLAQAAGAASMSGAYTKTDANALCANLFQSAGFSQTDAGGFRLELKPAKRWLSYVGL